MFLCEPNRMHGIVHIRVWKWIAKSAHAMPEWKRILHHINAIYTSANDVNVHIVEATEELQLSNGVIKMWNVWCACIFSLSLAFHTYLFSFNFFLMDLFTPQHTTLDGEFLFIYFIFFILF